MRVRAIFTAVLAALALAVPATVAAPAAEAYTPNCKSQQKTYYFGEGSVALRIGKQVSNGHICWGSNGLINSIDYSSDANATVPGAVAGWQVQERSPYIASGGNGMKYVKIAFPGYTRICAFTYTNACGSSQNYEVYGTFYAPASGFPGRVVWTVKKISGDGLLRFYTTI